MPEPGMGANNDHSTSGADRGSSRGNDNNRGGAAEKQSFDRAMSNADRPDRAAAASPSSNDKSEPNATDKPDDKPDDKPGRAAGPPGIGAPPSDTTPADRNTGPTSPNDNDKPRNEGGFLDSLADTLTAPPTDASGNLRSTSPVADRIRNSTVNYSIDDILVSRLEDPAARDAAISLADAEFSLTPKYAAIQMANAEFGVGMQVMRQDFDRAIDKSVAGYDTKIADVDQRLAEIDGKLSPKSLNGVPGLGMVGFASAEEARALMAEGRALRGQKEALEASRAGLENARNIPDALDMGHIARDVYEIDTKLANSHISRVSDQELAALGLEPNLLENRETGFRAEVYRNSNTGETVLAFQGTNFDSVEDWENNVRQGVGLESPQYQQALSAARQFDLAFAGEKRSLTGHSLGGGMAAYASLATGIDATTFNAAGLNARTLDRIGATREEGLSLVTAHHVNGEAVNWAQDSTAADLVAAGILGSGYARNSDFDPVPEAIGTRYGYEAVGTNGQPPDYRGGLKSDLAQKIDLHLMDSMMNTLREESQRITIETWPQ